MCIYIYIYIYFFFFLQRKTQVTLWLTFLLWVLPMASSAWGSQDSECWGVCWCPLLAQAVDPPQGRAHPEGGEGRGRAWGGCLQGRGALSTSGESQEEGQQTQEMLWFPHTLSQPGRRGLHTAEAPVARSCLEKPRPPPTGAQGALLGLCGVLDRGCLHKGWERGTLGMGQAPQCCLGRPGDRPRDSQH